MTSPTVETHVWWSFTTMLRSYAAAANLNLSDECTVSNANWDAVAIVADQTRLDMRFDVRTNMVQWQKSMPERAPVSGSFRVFPEGHLAIDGATRDLDHAAIEFIASVTERARGGLH